MEKDRFAGNLCGFFAIAGLLVALWIGASWLWDSKQMFFETIKEYPAPSLFWACMIGFLLSFAYGIKS